MFDKFTRKITKKIINNAKESVKEEVNDKVDSYLPIVFGLAAVGLSLLCMIEPKKAKIINNTTIINNYYIYTGGKNEK